MNLLERICHELEEIKAIDIVKIYVKDYTSITDYMLICSGGSSRHVKAIADNLTLKLKKANIVALSVQGQESCQWIVIDFNDIIVHVMQSATREYYELEKLWAMQTIN